MTQTRAHVYVSGRVQGVYFRQNTKMQAQKHGVNGWVCNLGDGRVEAVFEGEETAVRAVVDFCRRGPEAAVVTDFVVNWEAFKGEFQGFDITY